MNFDGTEQAQSHYDAHMPHHSQSAFGLCKASLEGKIRGKIRDKVVSSPSVPGILLPPLTAVSDLWVPRVSALAGQRHGLVSKHPG